MNLSQSPDPANCIPEGFLASTSDLISLLSDWAGSAKPLPVNHFAPAPSVPVAAAARDTARTSRRRTRIEVRDGRSLPRRREPCRCGECKQCLDNARWTRIFNEKFADPTYYNGIVVRHNSTLAEAR